MGKPWTGKEVLEASKLWKAGHSQVQIAQAIGRDWGSVKHKIRERRDLFPRRYQARDELKEVVNLKLVITPYVHKLITDEAKARGISINMLVRETLRDRFVRKLWKPAGNTSTEKVKYFNGSRG